MALLAGRATKTSHALGELRRYRLRFFLRSIEIYNSGPILASALHFIQAQRF